MSNQDTAFARKIAAIALGSLIGLLGTVTASGFEPVAEQEPLLRKPARVIQMVEDGFLWIDAEDFDSYGGWLLDTQYVHLVGSGYLIAAGAGTPVSDAETSFDLAHPGRYRLWVRTRNWLKEHAPGKFTVVVDGVPSSHVFGAGPSEDWAWEQGGEFELAQGPVRLALHDQTGYYGRCDAILLARDLDYVPPATMEGVRIERGRLTGLSLTPRHAGTFDVVVVGAGAAGSVAALASARTGAKTVLIQDRPVLGGNASVELGVSVNGAASAHSNARESGIIEEVGRIKARHKHRRMSEAFRIASQDEPNLTVALNQHVFAAHMTGDERIESVEAVNTLTGEVSVFEGAVFIDCTGDGWLGYYAGAEYRLGREAHDEFNEPSAPDQADSITMSACIMGGYSVAYRAVDTGQPVVYEPPAWAPRFPDGDAFGRTPRNITTGEWWLEHPGNIDDLWNPEHARDELIRITFGYWDYIKNRWGRRNEARNYALVYVPIGHAKRETRRLIGDYILTQNDLEQGRVFDDRISYGGWPLDVHHPQGVFSGKEGPFHSNNRLPLYTIPFRCLYSVNIGNLLFAGRHISVTHMALGSVRVQGTLATLGQAAGTAAALCAQRAITPRELCQTSMGELQQILTRDDQYIPDIRNEDPRDLARVAAVRASSLCGGDRFGEGDVLPEDAHPLNMPRAVMFPAGTQRRVDSVWLRLESALHEPIELELHVRAAPSAGDFSSSTDIAIARATAKPDGPGWVEFKVNCPVEEPFVWVWLPACSGVSWNLMRRGPFGACRAYGGDGNWHVIEGQYYAAFMDPTIEVARDYTAANVVNGVSRTIGQDPNLWVSDPDQPMPQWIELDFGSPVTFGCVHLTFDTDLNAPYHSEELVPECVRDYELAIPQDEAWNTLCSITGNFRRKRVHRFEPVTAQRLRLAIRATNGCPSARVFEVRVYQER